MSGICEKDTGALRPDTPIDEVTRHLATYNLVAVPVVDDHDRLLGAVSVDDVLDHLLPEGWRDADRSQTGHAMAERPWLTTHPSDQPRVERRGSGCASTRRRSGSWTERVARFLGTGRYLVVQTAVIVLWLLHQHACPGCRTSTRMRSCS